MTTDLSSDTSKPASKPMVGSYEWVFDQIHSFVKGNTLEISSRDGVFSSILIEKGRANLILTDSTKSNREYLRAKFQGISAIKYVENIDFGRPDFLKMYEAIIGSIDTIVAVNYMESGFITDEIAMNARSLLRKRGHFITVIPSKTVLFPNTELTLDELKQHNKQSTFAWLNNGEILKATYFYSEVYSDHESPDGRPLILIAVRKH